MITDVFFNLFGWPSVYAHILKTNNIARQFNEMLGYKLCENQENVENQLYKLRITDFEQKTIKIRKALDKLYPDNKQALFIFDSYDVESGLADFTINLIKKVFPDHKSQTKGDLLIYPF
jgi:spore coat polysaccharide biosynthesis predicted glycosyltransferase SpsG